MNLPFHGHLMNDPTALEQLAASEVSSTHLREDFMNEEVASIEIDRPAKDPVIKHLEDKLESLRESMASELKQRITERERNIDEKLETFHEILRQNARRET